MRRRAKIKKLSPDVIKLARQKIKQLSDKMNADKERPIKDKRETEKYWAYEDRQRDTASWKTRWEVVNDSGFYEFFKTFGESGIHPEKGVFSIGKEILR